MARPFSELRAKMSPEARAEVDAKVKDLLTQLPLNELRHARQLSQEQLAGLLHVKQASISKLERRADMYISTLRNFIRAMGVSWRSSPVSLMAASRSTSLKSWKVISTDR